MQVKNGRLELVDRLIANTRMSCKAGDPDTVIYAGELLKDLIKRREAIEAEESAHREPLAA